MPDQRDREQFSVCAGRSGTGTTRDQQRARLDGVINQAVDIDEQQLSCQHGGDSCGGGKPDNCLLPQEPLAIKHRARRVATSTHITRLRTLPGVGEFTALVMVAEIGDITRFPSARKLASWAGLTPTVRGPDLKVRHGHISKQGPAWLRWVMNQAAQTAKRSPDFAATYSSIARRRGKKIATIAISRKLLTRAWHLLSEMQAADASTPPRRP